MNIPMKHLSLDDRIRTVRREVRSRQPLQTRIDLVREMHAAASRRNAKKIAVHLGDRS